MKSSGPSQSVAVGTARRLRARRWWVQVHSVIGLSAGVVFVVIGLTGSLMVFSTQIDRALNPSLLLVQHTPDTAPGPAALDRWMESVRAVLPTNATARYLDLPREGGDPVSVYDQRVILGKEHGETWQTTVNPFTARVLGQRLVEREGHPLTGPFMAVITRLHDSLLLGTTGAQVVAAAGTALLVSIASGLWLWWPPTRRWRHAFGFQWRAGRARLNYDLHRQSGALWAFPLAVLLFTGVYMIWPRPVERVVGWLSSTEGWPENVRSVVPPGQRSPIGLNAALFATGVVRWRLKRCVRPIGMNASYGNLN